MSTLYQAFDTVNLQGDPRLLIVCDHASNERPPGYDNLGLPESEFERHIAYDIGVDGLTRALAEHLDCPAVLSRFSRLVIDPNRGEDDPTLVMKLSDGAIIPGNRDVDAAEVERRIALCHRPYHATVDTAIKRGEAETGRGPNIISIHSFTPQLQGRPPRPWHVGVSSMTGTRKPLILCFNRFGRRLISVWATMNPIPESCTATACGVTRRKESCPMHYWRSATT